MNLDGLSMLTFNSTPLALTDLLPFHLLCIFFMDGLFAFPHYRTVTGFGFCMAGGPLLSLTTNLIPPQREYWLSFFPFT
jgi:hypothetical protein